jgi:hypothetical protein
MKVYEQIGFDNVRWQDNPKHYSQCIIIEIPNEILAERSEDLVLIGLQLVFEHKGADDEV